VADGLLVLLEVALLDSGDKLAELVLVLGADLGECEDSSGLVVDDRAEAGLALYDGIRNAHLAAESGKENDELDGVDIVGDENQGSLLVLDETNDVVQAVWKMLANQHPNKRELQN